MIQLRPVVSALLAGLSVGIADAEPIVTTDLLRLRSVASIDVSNDGSTAVLAVRSIATVPADDENGDDGAPTYANRTHLYLLDVSGQRKERR